MKTFTLSDLKNHTGKIVDAAIRAPVSLTKHGTDALVIMSREEFDRRGDAADPRRAHGMDDLPADLARDLITSLQDVTADSYDDGLRAFPPRPLPRWRDRSPGGMLPFMGSDLMARITINAAQCHGRPCIRGMRIRVVDVLEMLANGIGEAEILADFPDLEVEDIRACLAYAVAQLGHPVVMAAE